MAKLLFRLRNVPDEEAREVRELLEENGIDYFETTAGNWGISMPGLWVREEHQVAQARRLLDEYQQELRERVRAQHEEDLREGRAWTQLDMLRHHPVKTLGCMAIAGAILYFSISVFVGF